MDAWSRLMEGQDTSKRSMCLIGGCRLSYSIEQHLRRPMVNIGCYVGRVSVECRSRVGQQNRYTTRMTPKTESLTTLIPSNISYQTHAVHIVSTEIWARLDQYIERYVKMLVNRYNNQVSLICQWSNGKVITNYQPIDCTGQLLDQHLTNKLWHLIRRPTGDRNVSWYIGWHTIHKRNMEVKIGHLFLFHMRFGKEKGKLGASTMGWGDVK